MNWGHKITIVIGVFLVGMSSMVYVASKQTNEMMDEKYYEKEIAYQGVIDAKQNLQPYSNTTLLLQNDTEVLLSLPQQIATKLTDGTVNFLRIEDNSKDVNLKLTVDASGVQRISKTSFSKGWYKMRIRWKSHSKEYYREENINIL